MPGLIIFVENYKSYQGQDQAGTANGFKGMTFEFANLKEVMLAAASDDKGFRQIVGVDPKVFDLATPFHSGEKVMLGLFEEAAKSNKAYWGLKEEVLKAQVECGKSYLAVWESIHTSHGLGLPHLTVIKYKGGAQVGSKIHVVVEADGTKWKYKEVKD